SDTCIFSHEPISINTKKYLIMVSNGILGKARITNASSGTVNARRFQSQCAAVVAVVVFEFSGNALPAP
ncbi:hypothetical protein, partial [Vibrio cholerae]|uniref:hypothetical protein n=1 Tax=Vibrio cholerae TaxID=666 RepID=UPI003080523B